jgi:hypothetical protein
VVTRRALLGAGASALVIAGCGPPEESEVDVGSVLSEQLRVSLAAAEAYDGLPEAGSLRANAEARARRVSDALDRLGGKPSRSLQFASGTGLEAALAAESAALRAHVAAVGQLQDRESRELLAGLITDAAQAESALLARLGRPPSPTAFPGQPV